MSNILTNNTDSSIILTLSNVTSPDANLVSMAPGESFLYSDVVVTNEVDPNYNVTLIQGYIDAGILLHQEVVGIVETQLQLMSQGNAVIDLTTGTPKLISRVTTAGIDNLQVLPVSNPTGVLQYIYYKSIQGMSISMDFGKSQTLISNANLLYPDEITSFAVQVYDSAAGVLHPVNRLYIGTLREGVKTFTPGVDTTYVTFDENASFDEISPIFKNSLRTTIQTGPTVYAYSFPTFCATYVLAIVNEPYNSGCPIFIASRTMQQIDNGTPVPQTKVVYKYLHPQIYVNNTLTTLAPNTWAYTSFSFPEHVLDVITEYIPTGALIVTKSSNSPCNNLYKIYCVPNATAIPTITEIPLNSTLWNARIKNISYLPEIGYSNYDIFITLADQVWRYSSVASSHWSPFLYRSSLTTSPYSGSTMSAYFNTRVTDGVLTSNGTTYLKELSGFIAFPKTNTTNGYVAILASEIGLIFYDLKLVNNTFTSGAKTTRTLLANIAKFPISDIKTSSYGENFYVFTSSYSSQIPRTYYENANCLRLIDNTLSLIQDVYYLKSDVEALTSPYYVTENLLYLNHIPSPEQLSYIPVLLNSDYPYSLISPKYAFKLNNIVDPILVNALKTSLAYKYYIPHITERIISSISPAEPDTLQLSEYKHAFQANITSVDTDITLSSITQFPVSNQITVTLPGTYISSYDPSTDITTYTSFVCIGLDNSIVLPTSISSIKDSSGEFVSYLTFASAFSGIIYIHQNTVGSIPFTINGLFAILGYSGYPSLAGNYPQVNLDSSVSSLLNDIRYIDANRLEISFISTVNTTINLI